MSKLFSQEIPNLSERQPLVSQQNEYETELLQSTLAFMRTSMELENSLEDLLKQYNLSAARFLLLTTLKKNPQGLTPSALASKSGVTQATISGLLNLLVKANLIQRKSSPTDGRSYTIHLSEEGERILQEASKLWLPKVSSFWAELNPMDLVKIQSLINSQSAENDAGGGLPFIPFNSQLLHK